MTVKALFWPVFLVLGVGGTMPEPAGIDPQVSPLMAPCRSAVDQTKDVESALRRARTIASLKYTGKDLDEFMFLCMVYIQSRADSRALRE